MAVTRAEMPDSAETRTCAGVSARVDGYWCVAGGGGRPGLESPGTATPAAGTGGIYGTAGEMPTPRGPYRPSSVLGVGHDTELLPRPFSVVPSIDEMGSRSGHGFTGQQITST